MHQQRCLLLSIMAFIFLCCCCYTASAKGFQWDEFQSMLASHGVKNSLRSEKRQAPPPSRCPKLQCLDQGAHCTAGVPCASCINPVGPCITNASQIVNRTIAGEQGCDCFQTASQCAKNALPGDNCAVIADSLGPLCNSTYEQVFGSTNVSCTCPVPSPDPPTAYACSFSSFCNNATSTCVAKKDIRVVY